MTKFENQGFDDFVFKWYVEHGKTGSMFQEYSAGGKNSHRADSLCRFLKVIQFLMQSELENYETVKVLS